MEAPQPAKGRADPHCRRRSILNAGRTVFAAEGFSGARLDDVAVKAGIAKGTIYLYFKDKQSLFEQVVIDATSPLLDRAATLAQQQNMPFAELVTALLEMMRKELLESDRREILRLVVSEGRRFPEIASFYYREVILKSMGIGREIARRARTEGVGLSRELEQFPQLFFAPVLLAALWEGLFSPFEPLDAAGFLAAYRDMMIGSQPGISAP